LECCGTEGFDRACVELDRCASGGESEEALPQKTGGVRVEVCVESQERIGGTGRWRVGHSEGLIGEMRGDVGKSDINFVTFPLQPI
jgi:hypothetical protein